MTRRCFDCGARAADGADVRECASCAFDYCNDHAATVGGVTTCDDCWENPLRTPPIHDGTCDCDGLIGGQGRTASSLRDGYVVAVVVFVAIVLGIAFGIWLAVR